jgi:hypothetical protein
MLHEEQKNANHRRYPVSRRHWVLRHSRDRCYCLRRTLGYSDLRERGTERNRERERERAPPQASYCFPENGTPSQPYCTRGVGVGPSLRLASVARSGEDNSKHVGGERVHVVEGTLRGIPYEPPDVGGLREESRSFLRHVRPSSKPRERDTDGKREGRPGQAPAL